MNILQIHTADRGGGAELAAVMLHFEFLRRGHVSHLLVGRKSGDDPNVIEIPQQPRWRGQFRLWKWVEQWTGMQYLRVPDSRKIYDLVPSKPDVLLIHSLHGSIGFFDLASLPSLCKRQPTFFYLQDMWTLTGHCAYALDCKRWLNGCGACPDLSRYPSIPTDGTRLNWRRKKRLFAQSDFRLGSPARWTLRLAEQSPLMVGKRTFMIPNPVDCSIFRPGPSRESRLRLDLPLDGALVLFLANNGARSPFKDFSCLAAALNDLRARGISCTLVTVGGEPDPETRASLPSDVIFRPYASDRQSVADYYRAANVFCHATKADVCPLTVIEAQACGTPVVATNIGGVPEIVQDGITGRLVELSNSTQLADALAGLLSVDALTERMGEAAAQYAAHNFSLELQADRFLAMFDETLSDCSVAQHAVR